MDTHTSQTRRFPAVTIVALLFLLCIFPGQFWIAQLFPGISGLARINPSLVFLDLPIDLPVSIDMILVPALFFVTYPMIVLLYPSRPGISRWAQAMQRVGAVFMGFFIILFCMLSGGMIYYLVQDDLSRQVRNGINSVGINADIHIPYPGYSTIHVHGSTVLLVCFIIGMLICIRKIRKEPGAQKAGQLTREQRMTPYERMVQERRMKEKQIAQETPIKNKGTKADKNPQPAAPDRGRSHNLPHLCRHQPVTTLKPEAVNYMPVS